MPSIVFLLIKIICPDLSLTAKVWQEILLDKLSHNAKTYTISCTQNRIVSAGFLSQVGQQSGEPEFGKLIRLTKGGVFSLGGK